MTNDTTEPNNNGIELSIEVNKLETGGIDLSIEVEEEEDKVSRAANFILNFLHSGISYGTF